MKDRVLEKLDGLLQRNDYPGAKRLLEYWLAEYRQMGDGRGVQLVENELMGLCRKLGEREQALSHAQAALDQVGRLDIADEVGAATTYLNSATVCKAFGMPEDALNLYEMARAIYERELPPTDERLGGLYNNMGLALVDLKRFREAGALYEKALAVMEAVPDKEPEQAITWLNMATACELEYGLDDALHGIEEVARKAMECLDVGKDRTDGNYAFVCEKCASVFAYYGYTDYAAQLEGRCRRIYEGT